MTQRRWARPVPTVGDTSSAAQRAAQVDGWAMGEAITQALHEVVVGRRDIRRYRPDPVPEELVQAVLAAGHSAPSVGHSQPWRFIVVEDDDLRARAAHLADVARLAQAENLSSERAARLLDLKLEGLREAPLGVVVACDRRTPAAGVLGRATFTDADMWSCACAVQNMWLTARAHGLGMGWVTLFQPAELADLLGLPEGVETLGWLCLGWPDERPPAPGLERAAWSKKQPLDEVILHNRWPADVAAQTPAPISHLRSAQVHIPDQAAQVSATDDADELLTAPDSLGVLDRALNRVVALGGAETTSATLVVAAADHPVAALGVSAYPISVTAEVFAATQAGTSMGAASAAAAGFAVRTLDAGLAAAGEFPAGRGDLVSADALDLDQVRSLVASGRELGREAGESGLVCLGEIGVGNTTVAAALACALLGLEPQEAVGLGAGSDSDIVARKREVVAAALQRALPNLPAAGAERAEGALAALGGGELAALTGVVLGAAEVGAAVVLDGLAASLPGLLATMIEPAVQAHLIAGQVSRERAHALVLRELGLEPLLALRLRAGEGVGAVMAASLVVQGLAMRRTVARTQ